MLTHETAERVLDAIIQDVTEDSVDIFLDWYGLDYYDFYETIQSLYRAVEQLPSESDKP